MGVKQLHDELELERTKLLQLVENAIEKRIPITNNRDILDQSLKVDKLIIKIQIQSFRKKDR